MNGFELITEERETTSASLTRKLMHLATTYSVCFAKLMQMASNLSSVIDNEDDIINEIKKELI